MNKKYRLVVTFLIKLGSLNVKDIKTDFASYVQEISKNSSNPIHRKNNGNENATRLAENHTLPITKGRFESFPLAVGFERFIISDEKEWYENPVKHYLGVLCKDRADADWAYAILTKSEDGLYRWSDGEVSLHSRDEARKKLLDKMGNT